MQKPMIGYLRNEPNQLVGERGMAYDYILAGNGLFLEAENPLIKARICIADTEVRGLEKMTERVELVHGRLPDYLLAQVVQRMRQDSPNELYMAVTVSGSPYAVQIPHQTQSTTMVKYDVLPNTVVDFHSHGNMRAHFSHTDDHDDNGFRISVVVGNLADRQAEVDMRIGVHGYHARVSYLEVFTGDIPATVVMAK